MQEERINYLKYSFFKISKEWKSLAEEERLRAKKEFQSLLKELSGKLRLAFFSMIGTRADTDFLIVSASKDIDGFEEMMLKINKTDLSRYLELVHSYIAVVRKSPYFSRLKTEELDGPFSNSKYLFVYPFVKKREWYKLSFQERQKMMGEHFRIGSKYRGIKIHTGYSFGLDDQEFVLAFEGNDPYEFLKLVEELRSSDASSYTSIETPIFTCLRKTLESFLDTI